VISSLRGEEQASLDVFRLQIGIVSQDLFQQYVIRKQFEYVHHADTHAPDAGLAAALAGLRGYALKETSYGLGHGKSKFDILLSK
jgi:hypothetical protein